MKAGPVCEWTVRISMLLVGMVHLLPATGVAGAERLRALYGVEVAGSDLLILFRHRAVLFGVLGILLLVGAFRRNLRWAALFGGAVSVGSFLYLARAVGQYNDEISRIVVVDIGALVLLVLAGVIHAAGAGRSPDPEE